MYKINDFTIKNHKSYYNFVLTIDKPLEMPLSYCFQLSRQEKNDHFRFGVLFVTIPKS